MTIPLSKQASPLINTASTSGAGHPRRSGMDGGVSFEQMLARGIQERSPVPAEKPAPRQAAPARQPATAAPAGAAQPEPHEPVENVSAAPADATDDGTSAKSDAATAAAEADSQVEKEKTTDDQGVAASADADQLLALVAGLTQPVAVAAAPAPNAAQTTDASAASFTATVAGSAADAVLAAAIAKSGDTVGRSDEPTMGGPGHKHPGHGVGQGADQPALSRADEAAASNTGREVAASDADPAAASIDTAVSGKTGLVPLDASHASRARPEPLTAAIPQTALPFAVQAPLAQQQVQAAAAASNHLAPKIGNDGWDQALGQKVVWMVGSDIQSASLTLNPPDLGPLQVVLNVSDKHADVSFTAAQPEVRQALEDAVPKLREMLDGAGIQLGQASVNAGTPQHSGQFAAGQQRSGGTESHVAGRADDTAGGPSARPQVVGTRGNGLVDTFA